MLEKRFKWPAENIMMLIDAPGQPHDLLPTKANIIRWMQWLVAGAKAGDSLFFSYSGHGGQQRDMLGEEYDGMNETLIPLDGRQAGHLVDDDVNRLLVNPLPEGVVLHAIIDACHSGTALDLPYLSKGLNAANQWVWEDHRGKRTFKGTSGGDVFCISGCDDSQVSADTSSLADGGVSTGALTFAFIEAVENSIKSGTRPTYDQLMKSIHSTLKSAGLQAGGYNRGRQGECDPKNGGFGGMLAMGMLMAVSSGGGFVGNGGYGGHAGPQFRSGFSQNPQISASSTFEMTKLFYL